MPDEGGREWLTLAEAAEELGLAHASLLDAVRRKALTVTKVNPRLSLVHVSEVERYRRESLGRRNNPSRRGRGKGEDE
jgi:hypothetical protein